MGKITILDETTRFPLQKIGQMAGICWNSPTDNAEKNINRAIDCIKSGHGRVMEYASVEMVIDGYSARCIREWYTHIAGGPTRLQESTRYVDESAFPYIVPPSVEKNEVAKSVYEDTMKSIQAGYKSLIGLGVPKEDCAMILPLGMATKIVDKRNLRSIVDMSRQRMCTRAYWEYRALMADICAALRDYSDEWKWIVENCMHPKCDDLGYCPERKSCGRHAKKEEA